MRILVTGSAGHLGEGLVRVLIFPDEDDEAVRRAYEDDNVKANEYLYRRLDLEDAVSAHVLAIARAPEIGFARYVVSATTPFSPGDLAELRGRAPSVMQRLYPQYEEEYGRRGWRMFPDIGRVYVNDRARAELGWTPRYDFARVPERLRADEDFRSELARQVGWKGYHGPGSAASRYPVDDEEKRP